MSVTEILSELPKLEHADREKVWQKLEELELATTEETPEMLAAIDAARCSIREGKNHTVEQARELIARWTTKSS
jgi:hypothetical protein